MIAPWGLDVEPLPDAEFEQVRRRAIFDYCKWDPQVEDVCTVARVPLVLRRSAWDELATLAAALAGETLRAEAELLRRPALHAKLGLPRNVRSALRHAAAEESACGVARLIRFDFHDTPDGWRISEANTDVPGGLNEASGLPRLFAARYAGTEPVGDPASTYVDALLSGTEPGAHVVLVHATAYSDDHQVMTYLAQLLQAAGARPVLASPANLRWDRGRAALHESLGPGSVDRVPRFFPAEWLPELPGSCGWNQFFGGSKTPISNPAVALLTQSKRFPLVWDELDEPLPTWRARLPETRDPRDAPWDGSDEWVIKPALGRVGEDVGVPGLLGAKEWARLRKAVRRYPDEWVAQRRFAAPPLRVGDEAIYPCVGVYTVDDRVAGAYGRLARRPLIDSRAQDAAVLVSQSEDA